MLNHAESCLQRMPVGKIIVKKLESRESRHTGIPHVMILAQYERLEVQRTPTQIDIIHRGSHTPDLDDLR